MFLRPGQFVGRYTRKFGPCFRAKIYPFKDLIVISDPSLVKAVLTVNRDELHAGEGNAQPEVFQPLMGDSSLLLMDGKKHIDHRRLMLPPFHGERMKTYEELMAQVTTESIADWPHRRRFALRPRMQEITLDIILRAVFGLEGSDQMQLFRDKITALLDLLGRPTVNIPFLRYQLGPFGSWRSFLELRAQLRELLDAEINARRSNPNLDQRTDVLSMLLQSRFDDGTALTNDELKDQLMTVLVAGHETTANALSWTIELLFRNPQTAGKLRGELDEGGSEYLNAVIKESLRVRPVLDFALRKVVRDIELKGHAIPRGSTIGLSIWQAHHDPHNYPQPERFLPERFIGSDVPDTYTWLPFGGGSRRCLGASFATFEMALVLREVLTTAALRPARSKPEPVATRSITLVPKHGALAIRD